MQQTGRQLAGEGKKSGDGLSGRPRTDPLMKG